MRVVFGLGVGVVSALAACSKQDDRMTVAITPEHVAAVNALVPPEWQARLVFEVGAAVDKRGRDVETFKLAVPRGWVSAFLPGSLKPADADNFGRSETMAAIMQLRVGTNCDGECIEKDWAAIVDRVYFKQFTDGGRNGRIVTDASTPTSRALVFVREPTEETQGNTVVTSGERGVNILRTWWKQGGKQMFMCEVDLGEQFSTPPPGPLDRLIPAFEKACSVVSAE